MRFISAGEHYHRVIRIMLSLVFAASVALAAPAKAPARTGTGSSATSDAAIENLIKTKLAKSKIGADHFTVRVQGGVAYWEGQTDVIQHKGSATRMAKTAGAKSVVNNIKISEAARAKARANLQSGRRRAQIKRGDPRSEPRSTFTGR